MELHTWVVICLCCNYGIAIHTGGLTERVQMEAFFALKLLFRAIIDILNVVEIGCRNMKVHF